MANVNTSMKEKRTRIDARTELQHLGADELVTLFLDTVDAKTVSVITASLRIVRCHECAKRVAQAKERAKARRKAS